MEKTKIEISLPDALHIVVQRLVAAIEKSNVVKKEAAVLENVVKKEIAILEAATAVYKAKMKDGEGDTFSNAFQEVKSNM